eukprot:2288366-Rhodomonas_salina.2
MIHACPQFGACSRSNPPPPPRKPSRTKKHQNAKCATRGERVVPCCSLTVRGRRRCSAPARYTTMPAVSPRPICAVALDGSAPQPAAHSC